VWNEQHACLDVMRVCWQKNGFPMLFFLNMVNYRTWTATRGMAVNTVLLAIM
jgi:hypothetical protein